jgi:hypothetical protein
MLHFLKKNFDEDLSIKNISYICVFFLLFEVTILIYSLFFNFDITDEGYDLYLHQNGLRNTTTLLGFQLLTHFIGRFFQFKVIVFRLLNVLLLLASSFFFSLSMKNYFWSESKWSKESLITFVCLTMIPALGFFIFIPTMDYNSLGVISLFTWLGSVLFFIHYQSINKNEKALGMLTAMAFSCGLAFLCRFTYGLSLIFFTTLILAAHPKIIDHTKRTLQFLLILMSLGALIYAFNQDFWTRFHNLIFIVKSDGGEYSSSTLLHRYQRDFWSYVKGFKVFLPALIFYLLFVFYSHKKNLHQNLRNLALTTIILLITWPCLNSVKAYSLTKFNSLLSIGTIMNLMGAIFFVYLIFLINSRKSSQYKQFLFLGIVVVAGAVCSASGTNTNIISRISLCIGVFGGLMSIVFYTSTDGFSKHKLPLIFGIIGLSVITSYCIFFDKILYTYRGLPHELQSAYSSHSPYLKGIKIERSLANNIDSLWNTLDKVGFSKETDRIFANTDIPGFLSAVGVQSYGSPWQITGYPNSTKRICASLDSEDPKNLGKVYILTINKNKMNKQVQDCLSKKIEYKNPEFSIYLGSGFHYRNRIEYDLYLEGPFELKKL